MGFFDRMKESPTVEVEVKKFNPHHDKLGRFTTANGATYIGMLTNPNKRSPGDFNPYHDSYPPRKGSSGPPIGATGEKRPLGSWPKKDVDAARKRVEAEGALKEAFADVWAKGHDELWKAYERRNLNFLSGESYSPADYLSVMGKYAPNYNEFSARRVASFMAKYPGVKLRPGREMSPSTYVTGPEATLERLFADLSKGKIEREGTSIYSKSSSNRIRADEVSYHPKGRKVNNYSKPIKGTGPVNERSYELLADFSEPVLRLWWD